MENWQTDENFQSAGLVRKLEINIPAPMASLSMQMDREFAPK